MSETLRAALLGLVQGVTEFLPVSSDGHLALFQAGLGPAAHSLALDVVLHAGTLMSMLFFFRGDLRDLLVGIRDRGETGRRERHRLVLIMAATVVTGAIGFSLKDSVERLAVSYAAAGIGFFLTAGVLVWGETRAHRRSGDPLVSFQAPVWHALAIGAAQGAAVWPGLSRSASTIAVALALGWGWGEAGRFSFLAAMPAIAGATLLMARDMTALPLVPAVCGFLVSFAVGTVSLGLLMRFLAARRLWPFALYTFGLGIYALFKWSRSVSP